MEAYDYSVSHLACDYNEVACREIKNIICYPHSFDLWKQAGFSGRPIIFPLTAPFTLNRYFLFVSWNQILISLLEDAKMKTN